MKIITLTLTFYEEEGNLADEQSASFHLRLDHMDCFERHVPGDIHDFISVALREGCAESGLGVAWDGVAAEEVWADALATLPST